MQLARGSLEDVAHPARSDDGQTHAVGDVVMAGEGVLDGMHGPSAVGVAQRVDAVATQRGGVEDLRTGIVVLGLLKHGFHVLHQRLHGTLHEGIVHHDMLAAEVLLHDVVDAVGHTGEGLHDRQREGVGGVDERYGGEYVWREIRQFVVGLGARDDTSRVVF